jgi:hypothetical protein
MPQMNKGGKFVFGKSLIRDGFVCYGNPDFSVHEFLKIVLQDCGEL